MKRIAFYGGSFDPPHSGHLEIGRKLSEFFSLDRFVFVPAFHAPHKKTRVPVSPFHRFAMLCLATLNSEKMTVSDIELEMPEKPFTFETLERLKSEFSQAEIHFVMGADSWQEITTWREWQKVLTAVNIIVVTRPGYEIGTSHVTEDIRERIFDLRGCKNAFENKPNTASIFFTDAVQVDISATDIRRKISADERGWRKLLPEQVARHIEKYGLYT